MLNVNRQVDHYQDFVKGVFPPALMQSSKPMVLKGFCDHWPAVQAAKHSDQRMCEYLLSHYSGLPVTAYLAPHSAQGRIFYDDLHTGFNYTASKVPMPAVLERILSQAKNPQAPTMYIGSSNLQQYLPSFSENNAIDFADIAPLANIWIGNQSKIAAHYDFPLNLACCISGKRRFTLFAPEQISNLYPGPLEHAPGGQSISMVDFDNPDFDRFPRFQQAIDAAQVIELEAGDALFIPSMWWHHVQGLAPLNTLITHWWRNSDAFMGRPESALNHAMLSLRNLPKDQRQAWKALFDYYIFDHDDNDNRHIQPDAQGILAKPMNEHSARQLRAELLNQLKR
ncbi:cupin-like domain-containing protein [Shewanella sp. Scap07]|uniref:cupin-like domain-containing protein n=1 Tax=Shewanella sp. Scap07 TaxID=2589987 RepID=UPI0015B9536D|nr:cupin-like domain-containing protein [Shewanella sp. Scap07]QLE87843.1 cupin-like domain-containing protein [Shewanella sp. Scap07]